MKQIFLLRHAKSSWDDPSLEDIERPLNKRGRKAAKAMAAHFTEHGLAPQTVLCSTAIRTRQTLDLLKPVLGEAPVIYDDRIYEAMPQTLLARLKELPESSASVLVVGHNPGLERLAHSLAGDQGEPKSLARMTAKYPTGSLAVLTAEVAAWTELKPETCRLESFICPVDLDD